MLEDEIIRGLRPTLPPPTQLNRDFANLIRSCWRQDPTLRPTFEDVLHALDRLTFLEDFPPPIPPPVLQKKDKINVDDQHRRHSQSLSKYIFSPHLISPLTLFLLGRQREEVYRTSPTRARQWHPKLP
jgi:hypothetical protein